LLDLSKLEKTIGVTFKNRVLLKEALTHRSYLNENPSWGIPHNERMEYLGDAVLELVITEELYNRFPLYSEGQLTSLRAALVNYLILADIAKGMGLENFILLSRGEAKDVGRARDVILANAFEALIGAIYLDLSYQEAKSFVKNYVMARLDEILKKKLYIDPKSLLQERIQEQLKITPTYKVLEEKGPDHQRIFTVGVYFGDKLIASGEGPSKQIAEIEAAQNALKLLTRH
jgi:ribonuclease-3